MALVAFVKGANVGGHRTFRPTALAKELEALDVVNVGAAGTFVIWGPIDASGLGEELRGRLPFEAQVMICDGEDVLDLTSQDPFSAHAAEPTIVQFVGIMPEALHGCPPLPLDVPAEGDWGVRLLHCRRQFVVGLHRREMRAIGYLAQVEKLFRMPLTIRSWSTLLKIASLLRPPRAPGHAPRG